MAWPAHLQTTKLLAQNSSCPSLYIITSCSQPSIPETLRSRYVGRRSETHLQTDLKDKLIGLANPVITLDWRRLSAFASKFWKQQIGEARAFCPIDPSLSKSWNDERAMRIHRCGLSRAGPSNFYKTSPTQTQSPRKEWPSH